MKRALIVTALAGAMFVGLSAPAEAGNSKWGFSFGVDRHGGSFQFGYNNRHGRRWRRRHRREHHVHDRTAIYQRVWCQPVYRNVFVGCDEYGNPIYHRVCVSAGYYRSVCVGYHCPPCGYRY